MVTRSSRSGEFAVPVPRHGRFTRSVLATLAALVCAAVPTLVSSAALAEPPASSATPAVDAPKHPKKAPTKHASKASKARSKADKKSHANGDAPLSKAVVDPPKAEPKDKPAAKPVKKTKKATSARTPSARRKATAKKADGDAPQGRRARSGAHASHGDKPCFGRSVAIDRGGLEGESLALVDCKGGPLEAARERLSALARPWGAPRPTKLPAADARVASPKSPELAKGVRLLDTGLVARINAIAKKFPAKTISLVSGYRPQSKGSLHQAARAVDLRVTGVSNEELVAFCRTLEDTGCGYYPNSSFVHVDVRTRGTGSVTWIDASGPGESPRYVTQWPPPSDEPRAAPADKEDHDDMTVFSDAIDDEPLKSVKKPAARGDDPYDL